MGRRDNRVVSNLQTGRSSKTIQTAMKDLDISALRAMDRVQVQSLLDEIEGRARALEIDSYTQQYFSNILKKFGADVFSYEMDMVRINEKISKMRKDVQFHEQVIRELKEEYLNTVDKDKKQQIYEEIEKAERIISSYEIKENNILDLKNKIRKEVDKRNFQKEQLEMKDKEMNIKGSLNNSDIDFTVLD
ncbi:MAG: hypothetical protein EOL97_15955 [Spirochaetia bacterium]|nr:hypothetical protein [Spirochaetia bacterium]